MIMQSSCGQFIMGVVQQGRFDKFQMPSLQLMDFEELKKVLPKQSVTWTVSDIEIWLQFIGLQAYAPQFKAASVDGSCLSQLTGEDLEQELKINSRIIIKKLMIWITDGVKSYDEFLCQRQQLKLNSSIKAEELREVVIPKWEEHYQIEEPSSSGRRNKRRETASVEQKGQKPEINELVIKQCETSMYSCYSLKEQGGMIGRNSKNEIHIVDENVSRFHAQIEYEAAKYYIRDYGSSSGTFIRIAQKTVLRHEQIVQMGSNQFIADLSSVKTLMLKIIEGPNLNEVFSLPAAKGKVNVGRKATNEINFPEDQHLSNVHSTIFSIEGVWYVEDLGTTNGTWIRLSQEGVKSQRHLLQNKTQFKLGSSLTFECQLNENNRKTAKEKSDKCQICRVAEKDCIFLPCKHNVACQKCAQMNQLEHCVVCGSEISQFMKIFKV